MKYLSAEKIVILISCKFYIAILFARHTENMKQKNREISMHEQFDKYNYKYFEQPEASDNNHPVVSMSIIVGSVEEDLVTSSRS